MQTTRVHLVRHGEVHNPEKVLYGRLPGYRLSDRGLAMAELASGFFTGRDVTAIFSSPLRRALQTAAPISRVTGVADVRQDDRLIEAGNHFEGMTVGKGEGRLTNPAHFRYYLNPFRPSWGEPYADQVRRVTAAVHDARAVAEGHEAVLVLHQLPIWVTRLSAEGKHLWHDPRKRQCNLCSVTTFDFIGPYLSGVDYAEPAAALYDKAIDITGRFEEYSAKALLHRDEDDAGEES